MEKRAPYIKPSLLRLEFAVGVSQECDFGNCKTSSSAQGQCLIGGSVSCATSSCLSVGS
jgi:hypothetical protein